MLKMEHMGVLLVLAIALAGHLVHGQGVDYAGRSDMETSRKLLNRGSLFNSKIIGGNRAEEGLYKFMASLRIPQGLRSPTKGDVSGWHYCGGVLVAENVILTAAHCVDSQKLQKPPVDLNRFMRNGGDRHEALQTVETRIHPSYKSEGTWKNYDIALLVMDKKSTIKPAELATNENCFEGAKCAFGTAIGWGHTVANDADSFSDELLEVNVPLVSRSTCSSTYKGLTVKGKSDITETMVCAGEKGKDACKADSGGPLLVGGKVAGIVSWGYGCGTDVPGVYASVPKVHRWIKEQLDNIAGKGNTPPPSSPPPPLPPSPPPATRSSSTPATRSSSTPATRSGSPSAGCVYVVGRWFPRGCRD